MLQETVSRSIIALAGSSARDRSGSSVPAAGGLGVLSSFELAERLVQVWIRSDQHLRTLDALNDRLTRVRRYLDFDSPPHRTLGARRTWSGCDDKRARCLALLRSERRTAIALMTESDARAAGGRRRAAEPRRGRVSGTPRGSI